MIGVVLLLNVERKAFSNDTIQKMRYSPHFFSARFVRCLIFLRFLDVDWIHCLHGPVLVLGWSDVEEAASD